MTLEELAKTYGFKLSVKYRGEEDPAMRFYASFDRVDTKQGSMLVGTYGNGKTALAAIKDYATQISNVILVIDPFTSERQEIQTGIVTGVWKNKSSIRP